MKENFFRGYNVTRAWILGLLNTTHKKILLAELLYC